MNIPALKIIRTERYLFAAVMVIVMFLIAQISGQKEIIFPEILAIMTGASILIPLAIFCFKKEKKKCF